MKVTNVAKAQKDTGRTCLGCRQPIVKGEAYKFFTPYRAGKVCRHEACGSFKQSELASNDKLSTLYAAIEDAQDELNETVINSLDDLMSISDTLVASIKEVAEMYQESASAIEDGFGHSTSQSEEMSDNASTLEDFANDVESAINDIDEFDEDSRIEEFDESIEDDVEFDAANFASIEEQAQAINEAREAFLDEKRTEWVQEAVDAFENVLSECPL